MSLFVIGLNHTTAPLVLRERVAFAPSDVERALPALQKELGASAMAQLAVLSTCNRMEVYGVSSAHDATQVLAWLASHHEVPLADLTAHSYVYDGEAAVRHAFAVASGMDSMVLGEPQVLGQMKQALRMAQQAQTVDTELLQWFEKSFAVAKDVRTNTAIGEHSVSMAAAAVKLAKRVFDDFTQLNVLLVGAGEMMDVVVAHLAGQSPARLAVANRSLDKAQTLLEPYSHLNTEVLRLSALPDHLAEFDVVVTCTASTLPIIGLGMVESALKKRRHRPMVLVDLGVPRDIESAVAKLSDAYLYTVDDLSQIVQQNGAQREAALADAHVIVDRHVRLFDAEQSRRAHVPHVLNLRQRVERLRQAELERALNSFAQRSEIGIDELENALKQMSQRLTNKLLHEPTVGVQSDDAELRHAWQVATQAWLNKP
ncbi:MAG: glutamyl-tRNA reductase [Formosimonas sp.]